MPRLTGGVSRTHYAHSKWTLLLYYLPAHSCATEVSGSEGWQLSERLPLLEATAAVVAAATRATATAGDEHSAVRLVTETDG